MIDPFVLLKQREQEDLDAAAFGRLPATQQRHARRLASMGFTGRQGIVGASGAIIGVVEIIANYLLIWPYTKLWHGALWLVNGLARLATLPVSLTTGLVLGGLALANAGLEYAAQLVRYVGQRNLIASETHIRWLNKLMRTRRSLLNHAKRITDWGVRVKNDINAAWLRGRLRARELLHYAGETLDFYGAIGLFRGTKWILDPRLKSGAPLFGNEQMNKIFGIAIALSGFIAFSGIMIIVGIWAKLMHAHLAASFVTERAPIALKIVRQVLYQPLITIGLTCVKFVLLPVIAATRQAIKSTDFTRGVAHLYGLRLRNHREKDDVHISTLRSEPSATPPQGRKFKSYVRIREFNRISLVFIGKFAIHLIDKSSPNYYEGRLNYYRTRNNTTVRAHTG